MNQVSKVLRRLENGYAHWCAACQEMHRLPDSRTFNGNVDNPTFTPSFKHTGVKRINKNGKWTGEWEYDEAGKAIPWCCHYIITDGCIHYCNDCSHEFKNCIVVMARIPPHLDEEPI